MPLRHAFRLADQHSAGSLSRPPSSSPIAAADLALAGTLT